MPLVWLVCTTVFMNGVQGSHKCSFILCVHTSPHITFDTPPHNTHVLVHIHSIVQVHSFVQYVHLCIYMYG